MIRKVVLAGLAIAAIGLVGIGKPSGAGAAPPRFLTLPFHVSPWYVTQSYSSSHRAWDFDPGGTAVNANVLAAASGTAYVYRTAYWNDPGCSAREMSSGGYGLYVVIKHPNGYKTTYAHLASAVWAPGSGGHAVNRGQKIGVEGSSGCAYGKHLHFAIQNSAGAVVNPGNPKSAGTCGVTYPLWTRCPASFP